MDPETLRARRRVAVLVLRVLCALPALLVLHYALFPRVNYRHEIALAAPSAAQPLDLGPVRLERRDRALAFLPIDEAGRDRQGLPRVVVRNNVMSADTYRRLAELPPGKVRLSLRLPAGAPPDTVLPLDRWQLDVRTTSDYVHTVAGRLWGLLAGLLLVGLVALLLPRLVYVLWPDPGEAGTG